MRFKKLSTVSGNIELGTLEAPSNIVGAIVDTSATGGEEPDSSGAMLGLSSETVGIIVSEVPGPAVGRIVGSKVPNPPGESVDESGEAVEGPPVADIPDVVGLEVVSPMSVGSGVPIPPGDSVNESGSAVEGPPVAAVPDSVGLKVTPPESEGFTVGPKVVKGLVVGKAVVTTGTCGSLGVDELKGAGETVAFFSGGSSV